MAAVTYIELDARAKYDILIQLIKYDFDHELTRDHFQLVFQRRYFPIRQQ